MSQSNYIYLSFIFLLVLAAQYYACLWRGGGGGGGACFFFFFVDVLSDCVVNFCISVHSVYTVIHCTCALQ